MGFSLARPAAARLRDDLRRCILVGGGADRASARRSSTPKLAHRARGLGRAARPRAVAVPGRRQFRPGDRAAARGLHRRAARAGRASPGSRSRRSSAWSCLFVGRALVRGAGSRRRRRAATRGRAAACPAPPGRASRSRSCVLLVFSKNFYTAELHVLLHLLPDRPLPRLGAGLPRSTCSCSWRDRGSARHRRPDRRPHRPQARDPRSRCSASLPFTLALPYVEPALDGRS